MILDPVGLGVLIGISAFVSLTVLAGVIYACKFAHGTVLHVEGYSNQQFPNRNSYDNEPSTYSMYSTSTGSIPAANDGEAAIRDFEEQLATALTGAPLVSSEYGSTSPAASRTDGRRRSVSTSSSSLSDSEAPEPVVVEDLDRLNAVIKCARLALSSATHVDSASNDDYDFKPTQVPTHAQTLPEIIAIPSSGLHRPRSAPAILSNPGDAVHEAASDSGCPPSHSPSLLIMSGNVILRGHPLSPVRALNPKP